MADEVLTVEQFAKKVTRLPGDMLFAGVVALTRMAKLIQEDLRENQIDKKFIQRNKWIRKGIRITPATKQKQEAEVFTLDAFMALQDTGGTRDDLDEFWIPGKKFREITSVDPKVRVLPKKLRDPRLFALQFQTDRGIRSKGKARPFRTQFKSGQKAIVVRPTTSSLPLDVIYLIEERIKIPKQDFFLEPVEKLYDEKFELVYDKAFDEFVFGATTTAGLR